MKLLKIAVLLCVGWCAGMLHAAFEIALMNDEKYERFVKTAQETRLSWKELLHNVNNQRQKSLVEETLQGSLSFGGMVTCYELTNHIQTGGAIQ